MESSEPNWNTADAIELWKHFTATGSDDKDRMMQVCNWLLTSSVAIVVFAVTLQAKIKFLTTPKALTILVIFAFILSIASSVIAVIYGGYANWNWAKANQIAPVIARLCGSPTLLDPQDKPWTAKDTENGSGPLACWGRCWSQPARTYEKLAPIFLVYFWLSVLSAVADFGLMMLILCA